MADVRPVRLQLSRAKGFSLQALSMATNGLPAVNCARPGKWGNPFGIAAAVESGYATAETAQAFVVECFRDWLAKDLHGRDWWQGPESDKRRDAILNCIHDLRGKNLACWCGFGFAELCHADTLLKIANMPICEAVNSP